MGCPRCMRGPMRPCGLSINDVTFHTQSAVAHCSHLTVGLRSDGPYIAPNGRHPQKEQDLASVLEAETLETHSVCWWNNGQE